MQTTTTPDTVAYLWLGLAALAVIMIGFLASLTVRFANLHKDLRLLDGLVEDHDQP